MNAYEAKEARWIMVGRSKHVNTTTMYEMHIQIEITSINLKLDDN